MTMNKTCAGEALSLCGFRLCNCSIALSPIGVAALSSPSTLAAIFITIDPKAGLSDGTPGRIRRNNGASALASKSVTPARSAILSNPSHRQSIPVRFRQIWKALLAEANVLLTSSVQIAALSNPRL